MARCRVAGELIELRKNGKLAKRGETKQKRTSKAATSVLSDGGISRDESSRWQKMAGLAEEKFENAVATAKDHLGEVTTAFVLREAATPKPKGNGTASKKKRKSSSPPLWEQANKDEGNERKRFVEGQRLLADAVLSGAESLDRAYAVVARATPRGMSINRSVCSSRLSWTALPTGTR